MTETFTWVTGWQKDRETLGWWHSFELPDGRQIAGVNSLESLKNRIGQFPVPEDLSGKRVLDIGSWDGWFSFEMERRGAEVLAIDCWDNPRFHKMKSMLNSKVEFRLMDIYDVTPETVGRFDIVLFMGVLYHLKHPLLALERVCSVTTDMAVVDSFVLREHHRPGENVESRPLMEFYETDEFGGQTDNWSGPTLPCLMAMCRAAGFARVEHRSTLEYSACVACFRKWKDDEASLGEPSVELVYVCHHTSFGINFDSHRDEYAIAMVQGIEETGEPIRFEPTVGGFGVLPISRKSPGPGVWYVNFKIPPGLPPGWHDVSVRVNGKRSPTKRIVIDMPVAKSAIRIRNVSDAKTWEHGVLDRKHGNNLTAWIEGLPENADRANVRATLGDEPIEVYYVSPVTGQVNMEVPLDAPAGHYQLEMELDGSRTQRVPVEIRSA
jgi:tRNA (mo5U34)-methyltransferase